MHAWAYLGVFVAEAVEGEAVFVAASVAVATGRLSYSGVLVAGALGASAGDQFFFYAFRGPMRHWLDRVPSLRRHRRPGPPPFDSARGVVPVSARPADRHSRRLRGGGRLAAPLQSHQPADLLRVGGRYSHAGRVGGAGRAGRSWSGEKLGAGGLRRRRAAVVRRSAPDHAGLASPRTVMRHERGAPAFRMGRLVSTSSMAVRPG